MFNLQVIKVLFQREAHVINSTFLRRKYETHRYLLNYLTQGNADNVSLLGKRDYDVIYIKYIERVCAFIGRERVREREARLLLCNVNVLVI